MSTSVLFLDIDGVLNSHDYFNRRRGGSLVILERPPQTDHLSPEARDIDPDAVALLNRVLAETGAKVVLSSAWRIVHPIEQMRGILRERGFTGELIGITPNHHDSIRWPEIRAWLDAHPEVTRWAAVDDTNLAREGCPPSHFVLTEFAYGLTAYAAWRLVSIFQGPTTVLPSPVCPPPTEEP